MVEVGLWYRPSYFPIEGETNWRQSCDREVNMVRNSVGVCDVSTLGKIDIQGPDAAEGMLAFREKRLPSWNPDAT